MDTYERKCTCGDHDCGKVLMIDPSYRVIIYDNRERLSAEQMMTHEQLLDWLSGDDYVIEDDNDLCFITPDVDDVRKWLDAEVSVLRRQLEEYQAWLERISLAAGADDATPAAILSALTE